MRRRPPDSCATRSMKNATAGSCSTPSGSALAMCSTRARCPPPPHPARPRAATAAMQARLIRASIERQCHGDGGPPIGRSADPQPAAQRLDAVGQPAQPGAEPRVGATNAVVGDRHGRTAPSRSTSQRTLWRARAWRRWRAPRSTRSRRPPRRGREPSSGAVTSTGDGACRAERLSAAARPWSVSTRGWMPRPSSRSSARACSSSPSKRSSSSSCSSGAPARTARTATSTSASCRSTPSCSRAGNASALSVARGHDALTRGTKLGEPSRPLGT